MAKPTAFFFHFNKPATMRAGKVVISLHYKDTCHLVNNVVCNVPVSGRVRKSQPRFVMAGKSAQIDMVGGIATIN